MLNNVILVGRLTKNIEIEELEDGKKVTTITLAIPRNYKNADGEYDTDFVECVLWNAIAQNSAEYLNKGDVVGIKGKLETKNYEDKNGNKKSKTQVIAEKVTFLSSKKNDEEN